ncbi:MAG: two-component system, NtrC family, sensor histidine kinase PilS [Gallionellaceae bacterium]|nr:MAG: two-component system, NtrC family, sensor histidine kinase PilS [Gallionellaceae bacterium]
MRDSPSPTVPTFPNSQAADPLSQESRWRSLSLFNLYRLILGGVLMLVPSLFGEIFTLNVHNQRWFFWVSVFYTLMVGVSVLATVLRKPRPTVQLAFQIGADIAAITFLTYFGGGIQSNLGMLLLVSLALGGMIARGGRITLLFAALASIAILLEHSYAVLARDATTAQFLQAGILSTSYFAVAWLAHTLSKYAVASERLAFLRGVDLTNMAEANRLMIQDMPDGVLVVDERGTVRQSNPGAERMLGYTFLPSEPVKLADCSPLLEALFAAWRQNKALGHEVLRLPVSNQMARIRFLPVEREGFWGAVIVLEDIQRAQEQAQQVKLAALGRLTANIAHEVRNPLSSISYATELLKEGGQDPAKDRLLQIILDNTSRLNRIVQDVMQVNRRDRVQAERLDLGMRLPSFLENLCQVEGVSLDVFRLEISDGCQVHFDRGHLEQVLWNLCRNALRYSQKQTESVNIRVARSDDGRVTLDISDDGKGVLPEAVQKLFEPFNTTDAGGTGLGLYIARELCEANGARIEYLPVEQGGACFRISFGMPMNDERGG